MSSIKHSVGKPSTYPDFASNYLDSMEELTGRSMFAPVEKVNPFVDRPRIDVPITMSMISGSKIPLQTEEKAAEISRTEFDAFSTKVARSAAHERRLSSIDSSNDVGISKMVLATPGMAVDSSILEDHLGFDRGKVKNGLLINQIMLPGMSESNVTFVADGIYKLVKNIAEDASAMELLGREPIKSIYYATESNPDRSRPEIEPAMLLVYSKLLEEDRERYKPVVDMLKKASVTPITFACVGGVLALHDSVMRVRNSVASGSVESSLVVTADTAVYDDSKAKNAEATQGAASVAMWITHKPSMVRIMGRNGSGSYHDTLSDFTKFGADTPKVYGLFSEMVYVYTVAKAVEQMEEHYKRSNGSFSLKDFNFFLAHVPFPKQAMYFSNFLFSHYLRNYDTKLYAEMQSRPDVGSEPGNGRRLTDLIENKLERFNSSGDKDEWDIVQEIENDKDIKASWKWIKSLGKQPEFKEFIDKLHLGESLRLPSEVGNSYASSLFVGMASMLSNFDYSEELPSKAGIMVGYGSGAQSMAYTFEIAAKSNPIGKDLIIEAQNNVTYLDLKQYLTLHDLLMEGDAARTMLSDHRENGPQMSLFKSGDFGAPKDLIELDRRFLCRNALSEGFHVMLRKDDGTGKYAYADKEGNAVELKIRH